MAHRHGKIIQFGAASEIDAGKYMRMTVITDKCVINFFCSDRKKKDVS